MLPNWLPERIPPTGGTKPFKWIWEKAWGAAGSLTGS